MNKRNSIALTLHAFAHLGEPEKLHQAMSEWYNLTEKDDAAIERWRSKYPVEDTLLEAMKPSLRDAQVWSREVQIEGTPTLFVNDQELKNGLTYVPDLKYYIRAKEEEVEESGDQDTSESWVVDHAVEV